MVGEHSVSLFGSVLSGGSTLFFPGPEDLKYLAGRRSGVFFLQKAQGVNMSLDRRDGRTPSDPGVPVRRHQRRSEGLFPVIGDNPWGIPALNTQFAVKRTTQGRTVCGCSLGRRKARAKATFPRGSNEGDIGYIVVIKD